MYISTNWTPRRDRFRSERDWLVGHCIHCPIPKCRGGQTILIIEKRLQRHQCSWTHRPNVGRPAYTSIRLHDYAGRPGGLSSAERGRPLQILARSRTILFCARRSIAPTHSCPSEGASAAPPSLHPYRTRKPHSSAPTPISGRLPGWYARGSHTLTRRARCRGRTARARRPRSCLR